MAGRVLLARATARARARRPQARACPAPATHTDLRVGRLYLGAKEEV
ncbi:hypothetical protein AB0I69_33180 [Streptomyces sp. NPDC050508]